jgi:hypothetical protein
VPAPSSFDYAIVRVVPDVEREEFINVGVILHCHDHEYLAARVELDEARLLALWPDADLPLIRRHLATFPVISAGGPAAGPIGQMPLRERWHWLSAPRSTIVQISAPHTGLCAEPEAWLERLMSRLVRARTQPRG